MADPRRIAERSFSTLPRVELPGALLLQFKTPEIIQLSVPYLGSNCLEQRRRTAATRARPYLSVPYLGSNCLER